MMLYYYLFTKVKNRIMVHVIPSLHFQQRWEKSDFGLCDRAVSLPCHEAPKEQRKKWNLSWWWAQMREKPHWSSWMVIKAINWESQKSSEWDTAARHTVDQHRNLKESQLSSHLSPDEGNSPEGDPWEHGVMAAACDWPKGLRRVFQGSTYLWSWEYKVIGVSLSPVGVGLHAGDLKEGKQEATILLWCHSWSSTDWMSDTMVQRSSSTKG